MKRGTMRHRKLIRLASDLGIQPLYAAGILEGLWHWTAETAPTGDLADVSAEEIAAGIGYQGDAHALLKALIASKWLDKARNQLWVHNWHDHADYDVHATVARRRQWFQHQQPPKLAKLRMDERKQADEFYTNSLRIRNEYATNRALPKPKPKPCQSLAEAEALAGNAAAAPAAASPPDSVSEFPAAQDSVSVSKADAPGSPRIEKRHGGRQSTADGGDRDTRPAKCAKSPPSGCPPGEPMSGKLSPSLVSASLRVRLCRSLSASQTAADITTFDRIADRIIAGNIGPPADAYTRCMAAAQEFARTATKPPGRWIEWFKGELKKHGHEW